MKYASNTSNAISFALILIQRETEWTFRWNNRFEPLNNLCFKRFSFQQKQNNFQLNKQNAKNAENDFHSFEWI